MSKSPTEGMIGIMATSPREGWKVAHIGPPPPPGGLGPHTATAGVGGVIGPKTRDTDYTRFTGGSISVERLKTAAAAGATNESTKRFCIIDSGAGTSTGPAPPGTENGWRPAAIEYCTDVVWLGNDEGLRVQAVQGKAVRAAIHTSQMDRRVACARRQG
jgi:hypothetical protein